ncbi:HtaA domain-containing protein [Microbacterium sp. WCS2018Hpa-9]|uniref:HtaA domain-containing protein n=1 Tax=Microbacterium sp. WCS2018Hpa-9 TaxID=3073635 RepID=UPI002888FA63|nr:HtaA domain-containing protein [Microbacterium sp. WCS2018Hpa-9]
MSIEGTSRASAPADEGSPAASPFPARADLGFAWSVKDSFLQYIRGMRDGDIGWNAGAAVTSTGEFFFPLAGVAHVGETMILSFRGTVSFTAHHGLLSVSVSRPRITVGDGLARLTTEVGGVEQQIAAIDLPPRIHDGDVTMWLNCAVRLSGVGPEHFGGSYAEGEQLAPLTVRIPTRSFANAATTTESEKHD